MTRRGDKDCTYTETKAACGDETQRQPVLPLPFANTAAIDCGQYIAMPVFDLQRHFKRIRPQLRSRDDVRRWIGGCRPS